VGLAIVIGWGMSAPLDVSGQTAEAGARAQASSPGGGGYTHAATPTAAAARLRQPIDVDGSLDEAAWGGATPISELVQTVPSEGLPVTERTEVRFLYDDDAIYVGARLDDRSPVTTRLARRDAGLGDSDRLVVMLDSYHDHETAYRFWTNPSGGKIVKLLGSFSSDWRISLEGYLIDERKDAVNSLVALRHKIAHGESVGTSLAQVKDHYKTVLEVIDFVADLVDQ
jgi:hypothetical protein